MKDPKKENSFLYTLYQKYVKKQGQVEGSAETLTGQLITETLQDVQEVAFPSEKQYLQPLYDLYLYVIQTGSLQGEPLNCLSFEDWCLAPVKTLPDFAVRRAGLISFEKQLCTESAQMLRELTAEPPAEEVESTQEAESSPPERDEETPEAAENAAAEERLEPEEAPLPEPRDAVCRTYITGDKMNAYLFAIPPFHGGMGLDQECVMSALEQAGILYGLDTACLARMLEQPAYLQMVRIAQGTAPVEGKDGEVLPQIDYHDEIEIRQNERGVSDFKNINSIRCLTKGEVICAILPPGDGVPGKDVKGTILAARNGKAAADPSGKNTVFSEDKTRLLAGLDGQVTLKNKRYHIEPVLIIEGNVDYSVGNLYFNGDIIIKGDVCSGFTVKAEGSVTVHGMVESADILAGGDVSLSKGMNGNFNGYIDAKGEVKTSFLENCTVYTEGALYADSIISSKIFCGDTVYVLTKHGAIIGGTITAFQSVEAKVIGSQSRRETEIILGEVPRMSEKKAQAEIELKGVQEILEKMNKNLTFLKKQEASLPPDKLEILKQLQLQNTLYSSRMNELTEFLTEIANAQRDFSTCRIKCGQLFPPTKISIGADALYCKELATKCMIYRGSDGIVIGSL